jgi:hypothetical protein
VIALLDVFAAEVGEQLAASAGAIPASVAKNKADVNAEEAHHALVSLFKLLIYLFYGFNEFRTHPNELLHLNLEIQMV